MDGFILANAKVGLTALPGVGAPRQMLVAIKSKTSPV